MKQTEKKVNPKLQPQEKLSKKIGAWLLAQIKELAIVLVAFLFLNSFVIASFVVPTGSMENEVMTGDFLFVNKFVYGGTSPRVIPFTNIRLPWFRIPLAKNVERGDVIVFEFPGYREEVRSEEFQFYLKRCIALPGDTLQVIDRVVYVNRKMQPLPRNMKFDSYRIAPRNEVNDRIFPPAAQWNEDNYGPLVIPFKGMTIQIGSDNFEMWETFIKREGHYPQLVNEKVFIDGKHTDRYIVNQDYLFGMGDHRDNSLDCRYWGFIPKENLIGSPLIVYWSWNTDLPLVDIFGKIASVRWNRIGKVIN
jgi:signal peptidase I